MICLSHIFGLKKIFLAAPILNLSKGSAILKLSQSYKEVAMLAIIGTTLAVLFLLIIGWHVIFPLLLGGAVVITAGIWLIIVGSIFAFCIAIPLLFLFTSGGAIILALVLLAWTIIGIVLFPILFPILLPLFIIFLFITYYRRKQLPPPPPPPGS